MESPKPPVASSLKSYHPRMRRSAGSRMPARALAVFAFVAAGAIALASSFPMSPHFSPGSLNSPALLNPSPATAAPENATTTVREAVAASRLEAAAAPAPLAPLFQIGESVATYAADCTTPQTTFNLGETVCAEVTNPPLFPLFPQRRFTWVNTANFILQQATITSDPQTNLFTLPATATSIIGGVTVDNRGTWAVNSVSTTDSSIRARALFVVRDPANAVADLSVFKFISNGSATVQIGQNVSYTLLVTNDGPDAAQSVQLTDDVPAAMTFFSQSQNAGPSFSCVNPSVGAATGTTTCTIPSLAVGATAEFTITYTVVVGTDLDIVVSNTAEITSSTTDSRLSNNSSTAEAVTVGGVPCQIDPPDDISVTPSDQSQGGAVVTYSPPASTGDCGPVTCSPASGSLFPFGTTIVGCSGDQGDPAYFNVTVVDTVAPTITCPANISVPESAPGSGSALVSFSPTANDNGPVTVTTSPASGSAFTVAGSPHTVTATATDTGNNTATCTFTVTITPNNCALDCPDNLTVAEDSPGSGTAVVNYADPTTVGTGCGAVTYDLPSGTTFNLGTTTVTATETATGASCTFTVTVTTDPDNEPPVITCPANIVQAAPANACAANVDVGTATATDNRAGVIVNGGVRSDAAALTDPYPAGETIITWTATDAAGNVATCDQSVKITENVPPTVTPPAPQSVTVNASCDMVEVPNFTVGLAATDNCTPAAFLEVTQSPGPETLVGPGQHTITIVVKDNSDNSTTVTTTFNVIDDTPPVITLNGANPLTVECHTAFVDPGATASDACAGDLTGAINVSGAVNTNVPGSYTLTYTVSDGNGNSASATRTVNVVDTTAPTITLNGQTITLWPPNHQYRTVNVSDLVASAGDSCDSGIDLGDVYISQVWSDEAENGDGDGNTMNDIVIAADCKSVQVRAERSGSGNGRVYTITFKVRDAAGNMTTATAKVKVPKNQGNNGGAVDDGPVYVVNGGCP